MRCFGFLSIAICAAATAWPTSLNWIPVSDILRHREGYADYSMSGGEFTRHTRYSHGHAVTIGLLDRLEIGYDNDTLGTTTWNAKLLLAEEINLGQVGQGALSVGAANIFGNQSDPYIVGQIDRNNYRIHAGAWRLSNRTYFIGGLDFALESSTVMVDYISGPTGSTWLGASIPLPILAGLDFGFAVGIPHRRSNGLQHSFGLGYAFRF